MLIVICVFIAGLLPGFYQLLPTKSSVAGKKLLHARYKKIPNINEDQVHILCHTYIKSTQSELCSLFFSVTWQGQGENGHGHRN